VTDDHSTAAGALLDEAVRTPAHVVFRSFVNETVLLNLESGRYFGLNATAGRMLEELVNAPTVRDAATRLAEDFGQPYEAIEDDVRTFCLDLESRGLIERHAAGGS
jgi:hypothetical protein